MCELKCTKAGRSLASGAIPPETINRVPNHFPRTFSIAQAQEFTHLQQSWQLRRPTLDYLLPKWRMPTLFPQSLANSLVSKQKRPEHSGQQFYNHGGQ